MVVPWAGGAVGFPPCRPPHSLPSLRPRVIGGVRGGRYVVEVPPTLLQCVVWKTNDTEAKNSLTFVTPAENETIC